MTISGVVNDSVTLDWVSDEFEALDLQGDLTITGNGDEDTPAVVIVTGAYNATMDINYPLQELYIAGGLGEQASIYLGKNVAGLDIPETVAGELIVDHPITMGCVLGPITATGQVELANVANLTVVLIQFPQGPSGVAGSIDIYGNVDGQLYLEVIRGGWRFRVCARGRRICR